MSDKMLEGQCLQSHIYASYQLLVIASFQSRFLAPSNECTEGWICYGPSVDHHFPQAASHKP